jgi:hypothetical protein
MIEENSGKEYDYVVNPKLKGQESLEFLEEGLSLIALPTLFLTY